MSLLRCQLCVIRCGVRVACSCRGVECVGGSYGYLVFVGDGTSCDGIRMCSLCCSSVYTSVIVQLTRQVPPALQSIGTKVFNKMSST